MVDMKLIYSLGLTGLLLISCTDSSKEKSYGVAADGTHTHKVCPDWTSPPVSNYSNDDFSNFGCAYNANFQVQLEDPEDYYHGNGVPQMTGSRESGILQPYMSGAAATTSSATGAGGASSSSATSR